MNLFDFLREYSLYVPDYDFSANVDRFMAEMEAGLRGENSSLRMLPTFVQAGYSIPRQRGVVAIDAGGMNLRIAEIFFNDFGKPVINRLKRYKMPGIETEVSKEEFYSILAGYVTPFLTQVTDIGFVFAYPAEILPNGDGRVIKFCKEVQAFGAEGSMLGENLKRALGREDLRIRVLNDTVATLLAGQAHTEGGAFSNYIGSILGTGVNSAYIESAYNIDKLSVNHQQGTMIINCELGAYDKVKTGVLDAELDRNSIDPGSYTFEKKIGGAYLGDLSLRALRRACTTDLMRAGELLPERLTTEELNAFTRNPEGEHVLSRCYQAQDEAGKQNVRAVVDAVLERAAWLYAVSITAVALRGRGNNSVFSPVSLAIDGWVYHAPAFLRERIDYYLYTYLRGRYGVFFEYASVDQASLIGGATAALMMHTASREDSEK
ncbi:MAG: hypothetical protein ACQEQU_05800 [Spirochaetota bacterium]